MGTAALAYLLGEQGGVNAAEDHEGAAGTRETAHLVPAKRVGRVNADPDDVAAVDGLVVERLERLVNDLGRTVPFAA